MYSLTWLTILEDTNEREVAVLALYSGQTCALRCANLQLLWAQPPFYFISLFRFVSRFTSTPNMHFVLYECCTSLHMFSSHLVPPGNWSLDMPLDNEFLKLLLSENDDSCRRRNSGSKVYVGWSGKRVAVLAVLLLSQPCVYLPHSGETNVEVCDLWLHYLSFL